MPPDPSADQARAAIAAALGQIGFCLPGSITIRRARCGKPRCACAADPPSLHGPYIQWTRTVHGKTVTRMLTPAQYQAYAPWFANARQLRALTAELEALSLKEIARAEGWAKMTPGTPAPHSARNASTAFTLAARAAGTADAITAAARIVTADATNASQPG